MFLAGNFENVYVKKSENVTRIYI